MQALFADIKILDHYMFVYPVFDRIPDDAEAFITMPCVERFRTGIEV